ncbi:MAG TPA: hypothetical protein VFW77_02530 [Candidatus Saccharimonadales bacterium]|nr:hypothetical protein [Candidatus Saccharimonadales bacterium]
MPVKVELQAGSPERLSLKHIRPGEDPFALHDYTSTPGVVIVAACRERNRCGEIYHIPGEQMDAFPDSEGVPPQLLNDDNLHLSIEPGRNYERAVALPGGDDIVRFIFTHFR